MNLIRILLLASVLSASLSSAHASEQSIQRNVPMYQPKSLKAIIISFIHHTLENNSITPEVLELLPNELTEQITQDFFYKYEEFFRQQLCTRYNNNSNISIDTVNISNDGKKILYIDENQNVELMDSTKTEKITLWKGSSNQDSNPTAFALSPNGSLALIGFRNGLLTVHSITDTITDTSENQHTTRIRSIVFSNDSEIALTVETYGDIILWYFDDLSDFQDSLIPYVKLPLWSAQYHIATVLLSADKSSILARGKRDEHFQAILFDISDLKNNNLATFPLVAAKSSPKIICPIICEENLKCCAYSNDGKQCLLGCVSPNPKVYILDLSDLKNITYTSITTPGYLLSLAFVRNNNILVLSCNLGDYLHDLKSTAPLQRLSTNNKLCSINTHTRYYEHQKNDNKLTFLDTAVMKDTITINAKSDCLAISADDSHLATADSHKLSIYDLELHKKLKLPQLLELIKNKKNQTTDC